MILSASEDIQYESERGVDFGYLVEFFRDAKLRFISHS